MPTNDSIDQIKMLNSNINEVYASVSSARTAEERKVQWAHDLDWNLLRCFLVIAEQASLSRAAVVLRRSQPAVSAALKRLEQQLGLQLAIRSATKFELTAAGQTLFEECAEIFNEVANLHHLLEERGGRMVGSLQLTLASYIVSDLVDAALAVFYRAHPRVTFDISIAPSAKVVEALVNHSTNIGICLASVKHPDLDYLLLYREHFSFFCGRGHRLYGRKDLRVEDLEGEPAVSFRVFTYSDWVQTISALNKQANLAVPMVAVSDNLEEIRRLLVNGIGIGALPIHVMEKDVQEGLLWPLPPYEKGPFIDVHLVTNPASRLSRPETAFVEALQAEVADKPLSERTYPRRPQGGRDAAAVRDMG